MEVEGECDGTESEKDLVRVLAGTAFAKAGEIEEALETLGTETEDLEAYVCLSMLHVLTLMTSASQCGGHCADLLVYPPTRPS